MTLTVLINAGPWLPVPPPDYGGIENVLATLIPELRARGVEVVLCTVEESAVEVDDRRCAFPDGQFGRLAGPYAQVMGITHAHMATVLETLRERPDIDLVHDHLEVVGPSVLGALDGEARRCSRPSTGTCASTPSSTAPSTARAGCSSTASPTPSSAPPRPTCDARASAPSTSASTWPPTGSRPTRARTSWCSAASPRSRARTWPPGSARSWGCRWSWPARSPASPPRGSCSAALEDPASPLHGYGDVRHYLDAVQPFEDGERIRWVGTVGGAGKDELVGRARAVLMPISWEEPGATAAIEALACGTPVIATRRGALPEIIEHGRNGFLADDESQFAQLMLRAGEIDPAACRRSVAERFSAGTMAEGYLRLYREVLARTGA